MIKDSFPILWGGGSNYYYSLDGTNPEHNQILWERVIDFEKRRNAYVYSMIQTQYLTSLCYVSSNRDEWVDEKADIKNKKLFAYVINNDTPQYSEFGFIGFEVRNGFLHRIY